MTIRIVMNRRDELPGKNLGEFAAVTLETSATFMVHNGSYTEVGIPAGIHHTIDVTEPTSGPSPRVHNDEVQSTRLSNAVPAPTPTTPEPVRVLVAASGPLQSQLLTRALRSRREFQVSAVGLESPALEKFLQANPIDVVLFARGQVPDLSLLRWMRISYPTIAPVLLADTDDREQAVSALRAGARGIFLFTQSPFRMLCKCINCVHQGEVWVNKQQMHYVLDALSEVPTLRVVNAQGRSLLTPREEQVVALVADGLSNRDVATELGLSEHTIKKYLLRIFDKVGISSRVELVLYAMSHGENRPAEWMPGNA